MNSGRKERIFWSPCAATIRMTPPGSRTSILRGAISLQMRSTLNLLTFYSLREEMFFERKDNLEALRGIVQDEIRNSRSMKTALRTGFTSGISLRSGRLSVFFRKNWRRVLPCWNSFSMWIFRNSGWMLRSLRNIRARIRSVQNPSAGGELRPEIWKRRAGPG